MIKQALLAGAVACLLVVTTGASSALPLAKPDVQPSGVTLVGKGGHGHGHGGGFRSGGFGKSFGNSFGSYRSRGSGMGLKGYRPNSGFRNYAYKNHGHHHRGRRFYAYGGFPYYAYYGSYGYGYGDECGWLRRRALATGSGYWWSRYEECRYYD